MEGGEICNFLGGKGGGGIFRGSPDTVYVFNTDVFYLPTVFDNVAEIPLFPK